LKETTEPVTVAAPSGALDRATLAPVEPGLARATFQARELGLYKVTEGDLSVLVNVGPDNPKEFQDVISTTDRLRAIADRKSVV